LYSRRLDNRFAESMSKKTIGDEYNERHNHENRT